MKRWLRICLAVLLVVGLVLIARRELGVWRNAQDAVQLPVPLPETAVPKEEIPVPPEPVSMEDAPEELLEDVPLPPLPEEAAALAEIDLEALRAVNGDVIGWLLIPGTEVSYPLVQGEDNAYYLDHTWRGAYSAAGSIFLECENDPSLEGFHTLIYGHRMKNGSMFGSLKYYDSLDYWREHPSVYLAGSEGISRYDIFSALEAGVREIVYYLDFTGREEEFLRFCKERSVIDTGLEPGVEDRFITLSTCTGRGHDTRWTVQAVLAQEGFAGLPAPPS